MNNDIFKIEHIGTISYDRPSLPAWLPVWWHHPLYQHPASHSLVGLLSVRPAQYSRSCWCNFYRVSTKQIYRENPDCNYHISVRCLVFRGLTRSSAVAVIADRTAYDVLSNYQTGTSITSLRTAIRFNGYRVYERTLLKRGHWAWQTKFQQFTKLVNNRT